MDSSNAVTQRKGASCSCSLFHCARRRFLKATPAMASTSTTAAATFVLFWRLARCLSSPFCLLVLGSGSAAAPLSRDATCTRRSFHCRYEQSSASCPAPPACLAPSAAGALAACSAPAVAPLRSISLRVGPPPGRARHLAALISYVDQTRIRRAGIIIPHEQYSCTATRRR